METRSPLGANSVVQYHPKPYGQSDDLHHRTLWDENRDKFDRKSILLSQIGVLCKLIAEETEYVLMAV